MKDLDVLVIGRNCIDYISVVDRFPLEDEKVPLNTRLLEGGGQGGTSACCVSRLGGKTAVIGNIGDDKEGEFCLGRLRDFNVDTRYVQVLKNAQTPIAYLFVNKSNGKRTIIYEPSRLPEIDIPEDLDHLLQSAKTLSLDPQTTTLGKTLKKRIRPDARLIYDCERWKDPGDRARFRSSWRGPVLRHHRYGWIQHLPFSGHRRKDRATAPGLRR